MAGINTGLIGPLGAYVKDKYRGQGLGAQLLAKVFDWLRGRKDIDNLHVDFESANQNANQFWPKYFSPLLY